MMAATWREMLEQPPSCSCMWSDFDGSCHVHGPETQENEGT